MAEASQRRAARRRLTWSLSATVSLVALMPIAMAQAPVPASPSVQSRPSAAKTFAIDIAAQPLPQAITALSAQTGVQVLYTEALPFQRQAPAVKGNYTAEQALQQMLAGSGLTYRFTGANAVTLEELPAASDGAMALPPLQVEGQAAGDVQSPYGPGVGYVATRSATGTKTDTPLIETPQSVTVITRDQMDAQGTVQNVRGILRYAPGTYISDDNDDRIETLLVRGFQPDQYLDGMRLLSGTFSILKVDPYMLSRAELLEGPSSVLYGQGSPGGLLNMVSKMPTEEAFREVQLQAGTREHFQGAFDVGGPITGDHTLLYRVTGLGRTQEPDVDHIVEQRLDISPAITWRPDNDTTLTLLANYLHDPNSGFYDLLPYQGTLLPMSYGTIPRDLYPGQPSFYRMKRDQYSFGYKFEHNLSDIWTLRQNLRYVHQNLAYNEVQPVSMQADGHTLNTVPYVDNENDGAFTMDSEAQAKFATWSLAHTLLMGVDYAHQTIRTQSRFSSTAPYIIPLNIFAPNYNQSIPIPPLNANRAQTLDQVGIYAQDQLKLDRWSLLLAGREDGATNWTQNFLTNATTNASAHAFTGHVGLTYLFDNGFAPYVSYSTSFQPTSGTDYSGSPFKPTTGEQVEAGVKFQPIGYNSFITLAGFNLTQNNVTTTDPNHLGFSVQTGQVRVRGLELSGVASLAQGLDIRASYTHLASRITQANDGTQGHQLADTPNDMASIWADYTIQQGNFTGLGFGGGVRYTGTSFSANTNVYQIPNYVVVDSVLHYDLANLRPDLAGAKLALNIDNLFDKQYVSYCSPIGCRWGVGRSVTGTVTYRW
jgi:iron complex outermembrane receptor protein